jgi:hypothetical protein
MSVNIPPTDSIGYNYAIARALFDTTNNKKKIEYEITQIIYLQIELILAYNNQITNAKEQLNKIIAIFFKDYVNEQGQLGTPLIYIKSRPSPYAPVQTLDELRTGFISKLNIREKMSMLKNFQSKENDCIMFSILIELSKSISDGNDGFEKKYPMLDTDNIAKSIKLVENILGFDIKETDNCYRDVQGSKPVKCISGKTEQLYKLVQSEYLSNPTPSPITLCWLWHPLVYGIPYQDVIKLPSDNYVNRMASSFVKNTSDMAANCMIDTYSKYPIFPELSQREQIFIKGKGKELVKNNDGLYTNPPWTPPYCYMKKKEPNSFYVNMLKRYNKYVVSNLSGHVMMFMIMAKLFNGIDLKLLVLANIIYMVPYNHSIHEIFQAAEMMGVFDKGSFKYSIGDTDLDNLNKLLAEMKLNPVVPAWGARYMAATSDKRVSVNPVKGGMKKTKRRQARKTRRRNTRNTNRRSFK